MSATIPFSGGKPTMPPSFAIGGGLDSTAAAGPVAISVTNLFLEHPFPNNDQISSREAVNAVAAEPGPVWLEDVYADVRAQRSRTALRTVFREIDKLLRKGEFEKCGGVLALLDVRRLDTRTELAFLAATLAARERIACRGAIGARIKLDLTTREGERAERLLAGLL